MECEAALIPLDEEHMRIRDEDCFYGHVHVSRADVERVTAQELPEELRADAVAFRTWLASRDGRA